MKSKTAKIFKGTPNASFEEDYQLYNKSISYLLKKNGNKYEIIKTYSSPIEATRDRDKNYNDNKYLLHYSFNDKPKMGKLKKGSAAAKAYMAKIRSKKGTPKKVAGVLDTLKRKAIATKKNVAYSVIDKTLKNSPKKTTKDVLNRAKGIIKNTYIGVTKKPVQTKHKDIKSHNVNIRVVSGTRKTGFISGLIIKTYTLSELKKINPIYFDKGNDKFFGVYKRKLIISKKLNSQVMIEASKNIFGGEIIRKYTVRMIKPNGEIDTPKTFNTIFAAADYIGKNIIL